MSIHICIGVCCNFLLFSDCCNSLALHGVLIVVQPGTYVWPTDQHYQYPKPLYIVFLTRRTSLRLPQS